MDLRGVLGGVRVLGASVDLELHTLGTAEGGLGKHALDGVLDDALAMLDDTRLRLALQLLQQEADSRQILLFTCQSREAQALEN